MNEFSDDTKRTRLAELLSLAAAVVALAVVSMSRFLGPTSADTIMHSLMSTQRLTFYYWGQDRLANVLALIGWPVQNVRWNFYVLMLVQGIMFYALIALITVFVARMIEPRRSLGSVAFMVIGAAAAVAVMLTPATIHVFMFEQQYVLSLVLYFTGSALLMRSAQGWIPVGAVLVIASLVVVPATVLFVPVVLVLRDDWNRRRVRIAAGATFAALVVAAVGPNLFFDGHSESSYREFSLSLFVDGWRDAGSNVVDGVRLVPVVVCVVLCSAVFVIRRHTLPLRLRLLLLGAPLFAIAWFCTFTANVWVDLNAYFQRYFFPLYLTLILWTIAAIVVGVEWGREAVTERGAAFAVRPAHTAAAGLVVAGLLSSVGAFRLATDDGLPVFVWATPGADVVHDHDVEFVVGDYWRVWPIVHLVLSRGDEVFGVTHRAEAIESQLLAAVESTMADPADDLDLLCIGVDEAYCLTLFAQYVGGAWETVSVDLPDPLVLTVRPNNG